jgi:hypothetical protein
VNDFAVGLVEHIFGPDEAHAKRVQIQKETEKAKRDARRQLDAEDRGPVVPPALLTVRERLARPRIRTPWRIEGLQHQGDRIILAAQMKTGKTTLRDNLTRSLVDGDPFLGCLPVTPLAGNLAILDFELSEGKLDDWLSDQRIENDDRVVAESMRGNAAAFDIIDRQTRQQWAAWLRARGIAYLMVDCLRPILDALGLDENKDSGRFLVAFDALLKDAGIPDALIVHHMGHTGDRSRGDSRLRDWPDAEWRLVRQDDDPASPRYFSAYGRDVDAPENQLEFDAYTRRLTLAGGSRRDAKAAAGLDDVLSALTATPEWLSTRALEDACDEAGSVHPRADIRAAIKHGIRIGKIATRPGPKRAILHQCASAPECAGKPPANSLSQCASAPPLIEAAHSAHSGSAFDGDPFGSSAPMVEVTK